MVQLTRIYTKSGDKGKTSLGNGVRVAKTDLRIEVIGSVDELNSFVGVVCLYVEDQRILELLRSIQNNLFDVGADLCMPTRDNELDYKPLRLKKELVDMLEQEIDFFNASLQPLKSFVLPGGSKASAYLHLARSVTRRAERLLCHLQADVSDDDSPLSTILCYLNRLSDLFFVLSRYLNKNGEGDVLWEPGK